MPTQLSSEDLNKRLLSLDFMRGFIMVLLTIESTGLFNVLYLNSKGGFLESFFIQFKHHPWNGLRFWDLIQPGFMFIAGTAMVFSINKLKEKGVSQLTITKKILKRSGWLFFWGVLLYAVHETGLSFELWDVLTQLSVTLLVAYFIVQWPTKYQIIFSVVLLIITDLLFRFSTIPGFDQGFTNHHNFGNYIDTLLMHKTSRGGVVSITCIPTSVDTIGGALLGKLLLSNANHKIKTILIWAISLLLVGYALDLLQINPIIKRIATGSFTLVSLGWCLLAFAACYYFVDIKQHTSVLFFDVIGLNSIFIYLFFELHGGWLNHYISLLVGGLLSFTTLILPVISIISCLVVFAIEWGICYFLYQKKIFFRL